MRPVAGNLRSTLGHRRLLLLVDTGLVLFFAAYVLALYFRSDRVAPAGLRTYLLAFLFGALAALLLLVWAWLDLRRDVAVAERLHESEARLDLLMHQAPANVWTTDTELRLTSVFGALIADLENRQARVPGCTLYDLFQTRDESHAAIAAHLRALKGESATYERAVGDRILEGRVEPLRDGEGRIVGCVGTAMDVSTWRWAEGQVRRFAALVQSSEDAIFSTDLDGLIETWNPGAERLYGYRPDEVIGRPVAILAPPDRLGELRSNGERTRQGHRIEAYDSERMRRDGVVIAVSATVSPIEDGAGRVIGMSGIHRDIRARKQVEEALRRLAAIVESSDDAIISTNEARVIRTWNPGAERLYGYTAAEAVGRNIDSLVLAPGAQVEVEAVAERLGHGTPAVHYEGTRARRNGSLVDVAATASVMRDESGRLIGYTVIVRDITERKRAEAAEARLASFPQLNPMPEVEIDAAGNVTFMNPAAEYRFPDLRDAPSLHPFVAGAWALVGESKGGGRPLHSREVHVRDTWYLQSIHALPDGSHLRIYGTDVTARRRAEEAMRESERRFRTVLDQMRLIGLSTDLSGRITYCNDYFAEVTGWTREELVGSDYVARFIPPGHPVIDILKQAMATGEMPAHYQNAILTRDGRRCEIEWNNTLLRDADGRPTGIVSIGQDVTKRIQALAALQRSESELRALAQHLESARDEEQARIAREIHDELAQSLTALRLDLSWLAKKVPAGSPAVRAKLAEMTVLTNATIEAGRRIAAELRPPILDDLGLIAALEWFIQDFAKHTALRATLEVGPKELALDGPLAATAYRIVQEALTNVARHAEAKRVTVRLGEQDGALVLEISDDGRGIGAEAAASAQSFGIVGMRERAMAHGGALEVGSAPGGGTVVRATIPLEPRQAAPGPA